MQASESISPEEQSALAEKIRSGEFFRESRNIYDFDVHDPMSERYFYLLITVVSLIIFFIAVGAMRGFYPLQASVPFIVSTHDIIEDQPNIHSLLAFKGENPDQALLRFITQNYVLMREEYDIATFDRNVNGVKSQSAENVMQDFQRLVDPRNPESPITLYQRHSKRKISIVSSRWLGSNETGMEILYQASVESKTEVKKSRWQANITFNYASIAIDENGKLKPLEFTVTGYKTKRLQDIK